MEDPEPQSGEAAAEVQEAEAKAKAASKPKKPRKKVKMQDVGQLKLRKDQLKKQLKELSAEVKLQLQKRRRLLRKAGNLDEEDLRWLQQQCQHRQAQSGSQSGQ